MKSKKITSLAANLKKPQQFARTRKHIYVFLPQTLQHKNVGKNRKWGEVVVILRSFTTALGEFLVARLSDTPEKPAASFALPGSLAGKNAINIYLCSIVDDADLRSNETKYELRGDEWIARRPPLRLKCTYIVSAWPAAENPEEAALSQTNMLCAAYSALALSNTVPASYLPAPMKATGMPRPVISIEENTLTGSPEFWTSAGCKFHPAFSFTASVSLPTDEEHFDNVVEGLQIDYKLGKK